jgi:hypothetical protein
MKKSASFPIIVLLLLLCLAATLSPAYAEIQGVATVIALRGTVIAQGKDGAARNLSIKSQIFQEDVLKTDKTGQLQIMFTDNSIISLGRDSEMKIAEYRWQPEQKDGALKTQAKEGTFRVMGGALAKDAPQNFKTETPTATIGIRGSMYTFNSTADSLSIVFQGGKGIEIFNNLGKVAITTPGFGTHVLLNTAPRYPAKFTEKELNNLNRQFNSNSSGTDKKDSNNDVPPAAKAFLPPLVVPVIGEVPKPIPTPRVEPNPNELPTAPDFSQPPPPPTDGIFAFEGALGGFSTRVGANAADKEAFLNELSLGVNWHNHRIFGVAYENNTNNKPVFFFGSVNGSTVSDLTVIGTDNFWPGNEFGSINGNGFGVFTGSAYDFFSFAATGNTFLIKDSSIHDTWVAGGGGQQVPGVMMPAAPTGSENWQGFVTGLSVNMTSPYTNPVGIYQSAPGGFTMTVNKDAGTISGSMTPGSDLTTNFAAISNLQVGGSTANSVYLRDDLMAALLAPGTSGLPFKPYGNFMVVADPSEQFASYATWGYWEIAYTNGTDRIMAAPHSLWIAGKPTTNAIITTGFTGTYSGGAVGSKIDANGALPLTGTCTLTADFNAAYPITSGNITFPGYVTLTVDPTVSSMTASATTNSFTAAVNNGAGITGSIKGAFFGPAANSMGGNFYASSGGASPTTQYLGIFGGNKK